MIIDISKMERAWVLMRLFNAARPLGLGKFADAHRGPLREMTLDEARTIIKDREAMPCTAWERYYFDYVHGRPLKLQLEGPELDDALCSRSPRGRLMSSSAITRSRAAGR
jgi:hypothetical protein